MNQHNQTMAQDLKVKTDVQARVTTGEVRVGSGSSLTAARGLKVKTSSKAGPVDDTTGPGSSGGSTTR